MPKKWLERVVKWWFMSRKFWDSPSSFIISVWFWNFQDGGSYKARFLAKNQQSHSKDFYFNLLMNYGLSKGGKIVLSQFSMSKIDWFFSKKNLLNNINLEDNFLVKTFHLDSIFEPLYFLKLWPIFDELTYRNFLNN